MLHAKVMPNNPVNTGASIIEVVVSEHNQDSLSALLAPDQDRVASEKPKDIHGVVGKRNRRVVIVNGVSDTVARMLAFKEFH